MDMKGDDYFKDTEIKGGSRSQHTRKECQFICSAVFHLWRRLTNICTYCCIIVSCWTVTAQLLQQRNTGLDLRKLRRGEFSRYQKKITVYLKWYITGKRK